MNETPFWKGLLLVIAVTIFTIIIVAALLAILVYFIKNPVRKFKYIDTGVFAKLENKTSALRNKVLLFITFLGSHKFLIPANLLLLAYFIFIRKYSWFSIRVAVIGLSSLALMLLLKQLFKRKRPLSPLLKAAKGLSFPSGHAITAVTFYGLIIFILDHIMYPGVALYILIALLVVLIIMIGFSRVYLRVHYFSDVIAGLVIGTLWLLVSLKTLNILEDYFRQV
jgi:undecaprenyl-diphosphatase